VLAKTESAPPGGRGQPVTRIERFGLNVNRVDHMDLHIGAEFFALEERLRPFVEYGIALPNNRQGYACKPNNPSGDHCLANDQVAPSSLTLGVRAFPWKRGFSLTAGLDIGVTGTTKFIEEVAPTPPWTLYIGAGWAVDTKDRPPPPPVTKHVEKRVEIVKAPIMGHIKGFVHEQGKQDPIAHAIVKYDGHPEMSPLATGDDGKFGDDLAPGDYKYVVTADGFKPGACDAKVPAAGGDVPVDCALEALPKVGSLLAVVRDADSNGGLGGVSVRMVDANKREQLLTTDGSGTIKIDNLSPGTVEFTITAEGYLTLVQTAEVKVRTTSNVDLLLRPKPKNAAVEVGKTEIRIKQQIQFALDSSVILPESFGLMTEIADVLIRNPRIKRVEIQGHTDNTGTPEHNKQLSQQRAESVRLWLTQHGVQGDRLVGQGYGQEKPLVPNVTAGNRARNRRVQFQILEQDPAPATKP
jgi:outer membrane protein OmpA-like peptidoglycan-associated protein